MTDVLGFFSVQSSARLRYILSDILAEYWQIKVYWLDNLADFEAFEGPKCCYMPQNTTSKGLWIRSETLLFETDIKAQNRNHLAVLPPEQATDRIETDVLSLIFFHLSRYEEYAAPPAFFDAHGRFFAKKSILYSSNLLGKPIVNQWIIYIEKCLKLLFPEFKTQTHRFRFLPTYDIDQAWAVRHKGLWRAVGGLLRPALRRQWSDLRHRADILRGGLPDPEFTFPYLNDLHEKWGLKPIFFWLLGDYGPFDKNISVKNRAFQKLIADMNRRYDMGLHPSYASNGHLKQLQKEVKRFSTLTSHRPSERLKARQHYLKLYWPDTYRHLLAAGIQQDFTLGYADAIGFRAGMASPYYWYDLSAEAPTRLLLYPFQVMDVTLKDYLGLSPKAAATTLKPLIDETRAVGGCFISLWHNSSLSNSDAWKGWRYVYETLIKHCLSQD